MGTRLRQPRNAVLRSPRHILRDSLPGYRHDRGDLPLRHEEDRAPLLPYSVVVYEGDAQGESVVAVLEPVTRLSVTGRDDIEPLAREVRERMARVLDAC